MISVPLISLKPNLMCWCTVTNNQTKYSQSGHIQYTENNTLTTVFRHTTGYFALQGSKPWKHKQSSFSGFVLRNVGALLQGMQLSKSKGTRQHALHTCCPNSFIAVYVIKTNKVHKKLVYNEIDPGIYGLLFLQVIMTCLWLYSWARKSTRPPPSKMPATPNGLRSVTCEFTDIMLSLSLIHIWRCRRWP